MNMIGLSFDTWLAQAIREGRAMQGIHKNALAYNEPAEIAVEEGLSQLEAALKALNDPEEHANSSAANYKDYIREEQATTGRDD